MKILIIEDELPAANRLVKLIKDYDSSIEIIALIDSNKSLKSWAESKIEIDIIFSDIELLDGQVFDALCDLQLSSPIIFTTAYEQYALRAFDNNGISYLLKPFEFIEVKKAIDKFKALRQSEGLKSEVFQELKGLLSTSSIKYKTKLTVKVGTGIYLMEISEITCVTMYNGLPYAYKVNGKKMPVSGLISDIEASLDPSLFFRINRSDIINANFIEKIEPYFNDRLVVRIKGYADKLIVSASRTPVFRKWLSHI